MGISTITTFPEGTRLEKAGLMITILILSCFLYLVFLINIMTCQLALKRDLYQFCEGDKRKLEED